MKKTICLLLALIMALALLAAPAAAEEETVPPEVLEASELPVEPAGTETTVPDTTITDPAEPSAEPTEVPAEPTEVPAEPTEVPAESTEIPTEPTEAPAADVQPTDEPAAGEPAAVEPAADEPAADEPAVVSLEPAAPAGTTVTLSVAAPEGNNQVDAEKAYACWVTSLDGEQTWKAQTEGYAVLTAALDPAVEGKNVSWHVTPLDGGVGTTCTYIIEGNTLYLLGGSDLAVCYEGHSHAVEVYANFGANKSETVTVTFVSHKALPAPAPDGEDAPAEPSVSGSTENDYTKGVWVHVNNGGFTGSYKVHGQPMDDISGEASIWVEFKPDTRQLPDVMPTATRTNGDFAGWYTEAPTEELASQDGYSYLRTAAFNGTKIGGQDVPAGTQVLYAAFTDKAAADAADQLVTFYLDWNGIDGLYGHCLTCTRKAGAQFTPEEAAVYNLNFVEADYGKNVTPTWEGLAAYWAAHTFGDYTFKGWSTDPTSTVVITGNTPITNGQSFYAVWEKADGTSSQTFERKVVGGDPVESMRINTRDFTYSLHAHKGASVTIPLACFPMNCKVDDLTWTLTYVTFFDPSEIAIKNKTADMTIKAGETKEDEEGTFKVTAEGQNLTITNVDGNIHAFSQISASAQGANGRVSVPVTASVNFDHNVDFQTVQEPTCVGYGYQQGECADCHATVYRRLFPLGHSYFTVAGATLTDPTCSEAGKAEKLCARCHQPLRNEDGSVQTVDLAALGHTFDENGYCPVCKGHCKMGDINFDDCVDTGDVRSLFVRVCKGDLPVNAIGDVNKDGSVDTGDVRSLFVMVSKDMIH